MLPFKNLYHCMGHTYGTWLPGDPRGFRTRHHRTHCEGDYKNPPPPGQYSDLYQRSQTLLKRPPVYLNPTQRQLALDAIITSLLKRNIAIEIASVDRVHWHVLAPFPDHNPRHWLGIAKKESSHSLKLQGQGIDGGLWAIRCQCIPIENATHAARTYRRPHPPRRRDLDPLIPKAHGTCSVGPPIRALSPFHFSSAPHYLQANRSRMSLRSSLIFLIALAPAQFARAQVQWTEVITDNEPLPGVTGDYNLYGASLATGGDIVFVTGVPTIEDGRTSDYWLLHDGSIQSIARFDGINSDPPVYGFEFNNAQEFAICASRWSFYHFRWPDRRDENSPESSRPATADPRQLRSILQQFCL